MSTGGPPAPRDPRSGRSEPSSDQVQLAGVPLALTGFCGLLVQHGYPAVYALLVTLALAIGSTLTVRMLRRGPDDTDGGPSVPRWA